jgi:hypothetical protein
MTNINGAPLRDESLLYTLASPGDEWASLQLTNQNTGRLPDGNRVPGITLLGSTIAQASSSDSSGSGSEPPKWQPRYANDEPPRQWIEEQDRRTREYLQERERTRGVNNLTATLQGQHVVLSWQPPLTGQLDGEPVERYEVIRVEGEIGEITLITAPPVDLGYTQEQTFVDTTAQPSASYVYIVRAHSKTHKGFHSKVKVQMPKQ